MIDERRKSTVSKIHSKHADRTKAEMLKACLIVATLGVLGAAAYHRLAPAAPSGPSGAPAAGAPRLDQIALTDHHGSARTLADFRGRAVVVIFGYTHCPDLCPTTLASMGQAMKLLGGDAARVQVVFITLDPKRDTQQLLAQYVPSFDPGFLGLYADAAQTARMVRDFGVFHQEQPGSAPGNYSLDHTAGGFVLDPSGDLRLFLHSGIEPGEIVGDLRRLLRPTTDPADPGLERRRS